jgi:hypothetical protein
MCSDDCAVWAVVREALLSVPRRAMITCLLTVLAAIQPGIAWLSFSKRNRKQELSTREKEVVMDAAHGARREHGNGSEQTGCSLIMQTICFPDLFP